MANHLVELTRSAEESHIEVRRGWIRGMPIGGVSYIGPLKFAQAIAIQTPQIMRLAYMENFPDKDNIPAYDKFVATHIFPRQLLGSNAFVRGEQLSLSHGDSLDFKDMMKNNFQAVQFYLVDPELLARVIKVYGKRVDFRQKEYENNPDAIFSL